METPTMTLYLPPTWVPPSLAKEGITIVMLEVLLNGMGDGSRLRPGASVVYDESGYAPLREGGYIVLRRATPGLSSFGDYYVMTDRGADALRRYRVELRKFTGSGGGMREARRRPRWEPDRPHR